VHFSRHLAMFLWPPVMQKELNKFVHLVNHRRVRKQNDKNLPSGVTPSFSYTFPERFGGRNCLLPVNMLIIEEILEDLKAEHDRNMDWGVPPEFRDRAEAAFDRLHITELTMGNI